jgi:hypothetical protein
VSSSYYLWKFSRAFNSVGLEREGSSTYDRGFPSSLCGGVLSVETIPQSQWKGGEGRKGADMEVNLVRKEKQSKMCMGIHLNKILRSFWDVCL